MSITQSLAATTAHLVLDHHDGVARVDDGLELREEPIDVQGMQARGRFVQHVQGRTARRTLQFASELDALRFAAREFGGGLAQAQVAEPDVEQEPQGSMDGGLFGEDLDRFLHGQRQHLGDVALVPGHLQGVLVVARAVAGRAGCVDAGHEQQLDAHESLALASGAASFGDVEREAPGVVMAAFGGGRGGEELADVVEQAGVGREVGTRRAPDRLLVDAHEPPDRLRAGAQATPRRKAGRRFEQVFGGDVLFLRIDPEMGLDQFDEGFPDEARLARPRNAGDGAQHTQRNACGEVVQVVGRDAVELEPAGRRSGRSKRRRRGREEIARGPRFGDLAQPLRTSAVEHAPAVRAGVGPDVDDPVGAPHHVEIVFHDEDRVAAVAQSLQGVDQRLAVGRVQPRRGLVEHIDDAEQLRLQLRGQPQPLQFARRERRRRAIGREVAQAQGLQRVDACTDLLGDALRGQALLRGKIGRATDVGRRGMGRTARRDAARRVRASGGSAHGGARRVAGLLQVEATFGGRAQQLGHPIERQARQRADVEPRERDGQRFGLQPLAVADGAAGNEHVARHAPLHQGALRVGERVQHVAPGAGEGALVAGLGLALERGARLRGREARIDRHGGRLFGEQDPVAVLLRQLAPRTIDIEPQRDEDVAQVLAMPRRWPGGDGALAQGQARVRHHRLLGHVEDLPEAVAVRAGALGRVGREVLRVQHGLVRGVRAGAGIQHAQQAGQLHDAAHRRARARRAAGLLQGDGGWQARDLVDVGHAHLLDQAPRVRRDGFQVTPLRLREDRAEGQGRFARSGDPAEDDEGVARHGDRHVLQVVFARTLDADEGIPGSFAIVGFHGGPAATLVPSARRRGRVALVLSSRTVRSGHLSCPCRASSPSGDANSTRRSP